MARNGSGVYSLPATSSFNPAVTGQSATATDWNTTATDLASALTQSISQDGQTTITANIPLAGFRLTGVGNPVNAQDAVTQAYLATFGALRGLTLSNDGGTPTTVLDIAAGACMDSTHATPIVGGAFTKSTAGSWTAGTGNNGMGSGLTIAISTWYHVFAIINNGVYDVYFDTSVTAANAPASTSAFRRIGSFKTDGSAHILSFVQDGDRFQWAVPLQDITATNPGTSATSYTLSVPTGLRVGAVVSASVRAAVDAQVAVGIISDLSTTDTGPSGTLSNFGTFAALNVASTLVISPTNLTVMTNSSAQVRARINASGATTVLGISTFGWIDTRGKDS
jgi:hypothetical protein